MKTAHINGKLTFAFLMLLASAGLSHAQQKSEPVHMPASVTWRSVSVRSVDTILVRCNALYNTMSIIEKVTQNIQIQLSDSTRVLNFDSLMNAVNTCMTSSVNFAPESAGIMTAIVDLATNYKSIPILKIPAALKNLNAARVSMQQCISFGRYTSTYTLPMIIKTINLKRNKTA